VLPGTSSGEAFFDAYRAQLLQQVSRSLSPARAALYAQLNVWLNLSMPLLDADLHAAHSGA
jgi:hypothetical protein